MVKDAITMRSTTIYPKNEVSLCNFLTSIGIKARKQFREQYTYCANRQISKYDYNSEYLIKTFNLPTEKRYSYYTDMRESVDYELKNHFNLNYINEKRIALEIRYGHITISTFGTSKREHKTVVRKVYCPLKEFDSMTSYNCEYERSSSECLR
jgi:hypothetical protein